jgi:hypothetical protein
MTILRDIPTYNWTDIMLDCLAPTITSVEVSPNPQNGLAYSRFNLNQNRNNFNIYIENNQMGWFKGTTPFSVLYFGNYQKDLYQKEFQLTENTASVADAQKRYVKTYWYIRHIFNDLLDEPQSYKTIKYIEELSLENRILTPYSAFVLPGVSGIAAFTRLTAEDSIMVETPLALSEACHIPAELEITAYPNPFNPRTTISILIPDGQDFNDLTVTIFNVLGQKVREFQIENNTDIKEQKVVWDGTNEKNEPVVSGMYLVHLQADHIQKILKIMLLR